MADKYFTLKQVTAALSQNFPCKLIYLEIADRQGAFRFVPVLTLELSEDDLRALQDAAAVSG